MTPPNKPKTPILTSGEAAKNEGKRTKWEGKRFTDEYWNSVAAAAIQAWEPSAEDMQKFGASIEQGAQMSRDARAAAAGWLPHRVRAGEPLKDELYREANAHSVPVVLADPTEAERAHCERVAMTPGMFTTYDSARDTLLRERAAVRAEKK